MSNNKTLLIIAHVWPEPNSSAAGSRMLQLIELFQTQNYSITVASATADSQFMIDLSLLNVQKEAIALNCSSFDDFVKHQNPAIVLFDRYLSEEQFGWRVAKNCPTALRILDTEDLHCLRYAREEAVLKKLPFSEKFLLSDIAKREVASILRCDISLIISTVEMKLLHRFFKVDGALLYYLPFMLNELSEQNVANFVHYQERAHFISIGNFLHKPNWDAVRYLKESIWPFVRKKLPKAEMHIYGAYPSQKVFQLDKPEDGFLIKGRAESATQVMSKARVCLAPLRFGAGLKGKLIEAMQCGTPSVTTSIGAEGMYGDFPWNGTIVDNPEILAEEAVKLYLDKNAWEKAQRNGVNIINNCYNKASFGNGFITKMNAVLSNIETHRLQNFTGAMLMHQTMGASKYMSKWIEEKNRVR